jgi:CRP-like cAMP-binding protein
LSLGLVGPGDAAGWSSLLGGSVVYPATVKALTNMKVARLETSGLMLLMNVDPKIGYPVLKCLSCIFYMQYEAALTAVKTA